MMSTKLPRIPDNVTFMIVHDDLVAMNDPHVFTHWMHLLLYRWQAKHFVGAYALLWLQAQHSDNASDLILRRGTVLYDFTPEEEDEVEVTKGESVELEYEVGGWAQVRRPTALWVW